MKAGPPRCRRWAVTLARHAAQVLPGARPNRTAGVWAEAMRRELDYIADDRAALRWALGCVVASYKARLPVPPGFISAIRARDVLRHVAACGALMLVIGFALLENAESQTEPPRPLIDQTRCNMPDAAPGMDRGLIDQTLPSGTAGVSRDAGPAARASVPAPETSLRQPECAGSHRAE
jgi:hypothetical protein